MKAIPIRMEQEVTERNSALRRAGVTIKHGRGHGPWAPVPFGKC